MSIIALLVLGVATVVVPDAGSTDAGTVSLLHPVPPANCLAKAGEIVVCGKDANSYRLPPTGSQPDTAGLPKAEWRLFGDVEMGVGLAQRSVGGYSAPAVMATIKIPF